MIQEETQTHNLYINMAQKTNRGMDSKAVAPQKEETVVSYINCIGLAKFFGLSEKLALAIAETEDEDGSVDFSLIAVVIGTPKFISLADGLMKTSARGMGIKQDVYMATYRYNKVTDEFVFTSSTGATKSISIATLIQNFGNCVIGHTTLVD